MNNRGFTLIELLVVVAIIAVLASMATPAVTGALEKGRMAKCMANLRQIGSAVSLYANDHENRFPPIETDPPSLGNEGKPALETLSPYGVSADTLRCPSDAAGRRTYLKYGSSYFFSPVPQGELASAINIYRRDGSTFQIQNPGRVTICSDYGDTHPGGLGMNVLKADGSVQKR